MAIPIRCRAHSAGEARPAELVAAEVAGGIGRPDDAGAAFDEAAVALFAEAEAFGGFARVAAADERDRGHPEERQRNSDGGRGFENGQPSIALMLST